MILFISGIILAALSTLIVRYISQGRSVVATIVVTLSTYVQLTAIVSIINTNNMLPYLIGIAVGTFGTIQYDKKKTPLQ